MWGRCIRPTLPMLDRSLARRALPYGPVLLAAALVVLFQLPLLGEPMENDEGVYFTVAASGDLPYASAFDHKPPVIYAWYWLALALNSGVASAMLIHGIVTCLLALTAVAVYATGRVMIGHGFGAVAALAFSLFVANQYLQFNGNTEAFGLLPLTLSLLAFVAGCKTGIVSRFVLAGAFGALATLTKTSMAFNLLAMLAFLIWMGIEGDVTWRKAARASGALVSGAGLVTGLILLPWVMAGHFDDFWYANVTFNMMYSEPIWHVDVAEVSDNLALILAASVAVWGLAALGGIAGQLQPRQKRLMLLWIAGSLVGISWTSHFLPHYYVQLLPGASLLAAAGVTWIASRWSTHRFRLATYALMGPAALLTMATVSGVYMSSDVSAAHVVKWMHDGYAKRNVAVGDVADRVAALSAEDETIYNLGWESQIYALTGRRPAARVFKLSNIIDAPNLGDEVISHLEASPPALIVDTSVGVGPRGDRVPLVSEELKAPFESLIERRYRLVETVRFADKLADIYRRRD